MPKYRKKPVEIEAVQFLGFTLPNFNEFPQWLTDELDFYEGRIKIFQDPFRMEIKNSEGYVKVSKGDYIIKGVNGELYPCKPDIFEKTYEVVAE